MKRVQKCNVLLLVQFFYSRVTGEVLTFNELCLKFKEVFKNCKFKKFQFEFKCHSELENQSMLSSLQLISLILYTTDYNAL